MGVISLCSRIQENVYYLWNKRKTQNYYIKGKLNRVTKKIEK